MDVYRISLKEEGMLHSGKPVTIPTFFIRCVAVIGFKMRVFHKVVEFPTFSI